MSNEERQELLGWLYSLENFGIKLGLENMKRLLDALGNPQNSYRTIHVAGTNGKGSVCAITASVLSSEGYVTGLYTSPHFVDFEERIKIDGVCIKEEELLQYAAKVRKISEEIFGSDRRQITFFEITTAIAFLYFAEKRVDYAVIEVGLGGRLDATNVIIPQISAITHIALEHTEYLGGTLREIAREKAGIIKKGVPVLTAETQNEPLEEFINISKERDTTLEKAYEIVDIATKENTFGRLKFSAYGISAYENLECPLWGAYQIPNITLAFAIIERMQRMGTYISDRAVRNGIAAVFWPGRLQIAKHGNGGVYVFDSAHNPDAAHALSASVSDITAEKFLCVIGVLSDKNLDGIIESIARISYEFICAAPVTSRARRVDDIVKAVERAGKKAVKAESVSGAMNIAGKYAGGRKVLVTGSLRTVGEAMKWWYDSFGERLWRND
jgi:dihydrofolate synthase/folylpolyglutamate synthase